MSDQSNKTKNQETQEAKEQVAARELGKKMVERAREVGAVQ